MNMTNENYVISIGTVAFTEHYYREKEGWIKISASGRKYHATAEQVLNHVLSALAGMKKGLTVRVEHYDDPEERPLGRPK